MSALLPAALLLLWSAIAASAVAGFVAAPLLGEPFAALALHPRRPETAAAVALGLLGYPLAYLAGFALLGHASVITGVLLGSGHAALLALRSFRQGGAALVSVNARRLLLCVIYGAVLGFAFVMP